MHDNRCSFAICDANITIGIAAGACLLIAIVGGIVLMCTFLSSKKEGGYSGFAGWLFSVLRFEKLMSETLLRACYYISALFVTLFFLVLLFLPTEISIAFRIVLCVIVMPVLNIIVRFAYEMMLIKLIQYRNILEINKRLRGIDLERLQSKQEAEKTGTPQQTPPAWSGTAPGIVYCRNCGSGYSSKKTVCPKCGAPR